MRVLCVAALMVLAGCASAPRDAEPALASATTAAASSTSAQLNTAAEASEQQAFKPPPGFKARIVDWSVVYCKKTPVLGSRFPKEMCMTEAQLKDHMATNESMRQNKDQASRICSNPAACGNEG